MIKKSFKVPLYCFDCTFIELEGKEDADALSRELRRLRVTEDIYEELVVSCREGDVDGGWTITNFGNKRICVVLLPMRSDDRRISVLGHEKRHVEDDILSHCGVDDKEASAYLAGFLSLHLR